MTVVIHVNVRWVEAYSQYQSLPSDYFLFYKHSRDVTDMRRNLVIYVRTKCWQITGVLEQRLEVGWETTMQICSLELLQEIRPIQDTE